MATSSTLTGNMIQLATPAEHLAGANYVVNGVPADTADEVWAIIGAMPFGRGYTVFSPAGFDTDEFLPY